MKIMRSLIGAALAALLIGTAGCGSSRQDFVYTTSPAAPVVTTGTVQVRHTLAREVATYVRQLEFTGFDSEGREIYNFGPVPKSTVITLEQVPTEVTSFRIDYLSEGGVVGVYETEVEIVPGQTTVIENPDWTNTAPRTADFGQSTVALDDGAGPLAMTLVDLDGDGHLDAVSADTIAGGISVLLGRGDGTFDAPVFHPTGTGAVAIRSGDFNGDGHPDLAVANYGTPLVDGFLTVLLGDGEGGFSSAIELTAGEGPTELAIGDLNGDGQVDLISSDFLSDTVTVFLGDGEGEFERLGAYPTGDRPRALGLGDLDEDGHLDLFVANEGPPGAGDVAVLIGNGDGSFGAPSFLTAGKNCHSVALGDLNGDRHLDAVVANFVSHEISVFLGRGDGTFEPSVEYDTDPIPLNVTLEDFDGDGRLDVAVATSGDGSVNLFAGRGDGTLAEPTNLPAGDTTFFVTDGDLNGDGKPDLVTANQGSDDLTVFLNQTP